MTDKRGRAIEELSEENERLRKEIERLQTEFRHEREEILGIIGGYPSTYEQNKAGVSPITITVPQAVAIKFQKLKTTAAVSGKVRQ